MSSKPPRRCLGCGRSTDSSLCYTCGQKRAQRKVTSAQAGEVFARKGRACVYCGKRATTIDHDVPVARGGLTVMSNLFPACASCNFRKGDRTGFEFRALRRARA